MLLVCYALEKQSQCKPTLPIRLGETFLINTTTNILQTELPLPTQVPLAPITLTKGNKDLGQFNE